jgi:transcriptional regulator with PAS, ATPase and Fis domain
LECAPIAIDVRIIAATNKNLELAIKAGAFRPDLYYRLKVIRIQTPALREIAEDIPLMANLLLAGQTRSYRETGHTHSLVHNGLL